MLSLIFLRFWPVFLPLIAYWLWLKYVGRKATINGQPVLRFRDGPWYWAVLTSLLIGLACFVFLGAESIGGQKGVYTPPRLENGVVVPGSVAP